MAGKYYAALNEMYAALNIACRTFDVPGTRSYIYTSHIVYLFIYIFILKSLKVSNISQNLETFNYYPFLAPIKRGENNAS